MSQPKFADYFVEGAYHPYEYSVRLAHPAPVEGAPADLRLHQVRLHEFQHGIDHTATPWGFELSRQMFEALGSVRQGRTESDLWRVIRLHDTVRRLNHDRYYRVKGPAAGITPRARWSWTFSSGLEFDPHGRVDNNRPIIFTRFEDAATGKVIQRQPLSAAALLEARAIYVELQLALAAPDPRSEIHKFVRRAYDAELAEYSAAAHVVATILGVDVISAYEIASAAAWYALLRPAFRPQDLARGAWRDALGDGKLAAFATHRDPGFVFATLVQARAPFNDDARAWLDDAVERCGFPSVKATITDALEQVGGSPRLETEWAATEFEMLRQTTMNNFILLQHQFGLLLRGGQLGDLAALHLPDCYYADGRMSRHGQRVLPTTSPEDLRLFGKEIQDSIDWFLTACR